MNFMTRTYRQKRRAEARARTRQKIVDATVELHQAKGVAATTVADIADRAGVGKVTVYRHFPDEMALVAACSGHYGERHPLPDVEAWRELADPEQRLRRGLRDTYRYHRETEAMMAQVLAETRDLPVMEPYRAHWRRAVDVLAEPWPTAGREKRLLKAGIAVALDFETWRRLVRDQGLTDDQAVGLMMRLAQSSDA